MIEHTTEVREAHRFDETALTRYLAGHVPAIRTPIRVRQFRGGQSNPTFLLLDADDRAFVLRKKPPGPILASAHQVEREHRVMQALAGSEVAVPHMHILCEDAGVIGTPFFVMDAVAGRVFRNPALPEVATEDRRPVYLAMADTLAALHQVDWRGAGLEGYGRPADYFRRQVSRWAGQLDKSGTDDASVMGRLVAWLEANVPADEPATIVHGDYRLENLVFADGAPQVLAVLDWELSTLGHPLADLAYNCLPYHLPSRLKGLGGIADLDLPALGIPGEEEYVDAYRARVGRPPIESWNFYLAFSLFRTAAILQGVYARALQNNASSADALEVGGNAGEVAEIALATALGKH